MDSVCIICGSKNFKIKSNRFCSQECIHQYGTQKMNEKIKCRICDKEISKANYNKHLKTHEIKKHHYFCENCGKEVYEKYGSGRFCSSKCARGFSTKNKREQINKKVSEKIKQKISNGEKIGFCTSGRLVKLENKVCPICGNNFKADEKFGKKTCSKECSHKATALNNKGKKHNIKDTSRMGGLRPGGGKSKQISYTNWLGYKMSLNKEEIEVAKVLDEKKLNWNRNRKGFPYLTRDGKQRKYYPDFVINDNKYIEYKGWVTEEMEWKMKNAIQKNKIDLLVIVGTDPRYQRFGISLNNLYERFFETNGRNS